MENIIISFKEIKDIENFIRITGKYNFDVTLSQNRYEVDGKSLMGILSLDIIKPVEVVINNPDDTVEEFINEIKPYVYLTKEISIRFKEITDVERFVKISHKYEFDVLLSQGKYTVSGKSMMGIFSLDVTRPITVIVESNDKTATAFENEIKDYIVKGQTV
jgi:phosphotransferase system HPr-like phosphotransfer protein